MTLLFNLLVLFGFILFLYKFSKRNWKITFIYGLIVLQAVAIIPSLIYLEEGIFISEQGRNSFFVGATFYYVVYFIITLLVIKLTFNSLNQFKALSPKFSYKGHNLEFMILISIVIISLGILIYNLSLSRSPMFDDSITRFTYWQHSRFPFLNKIFGNVSIFIPFALGIIYGRYKKLSVLLLAVYFGYNFLIGQKFSPIVSGLFSFFLPIILLSVYRFNLKRFLNLKLLLVFFVIFGTAYFVIYKKYEQIMPYANVKIYDPNEAILYRIFGLQGHLMWGASEAYIYKGESKSYDLSDLTYGMHKLMYRFAANQEGLEDSLAMGFNFTNGYPSIFLLIFPWWLALICHILMAIVLLGGVGWLLKEFIIRQAFLFSVITYQMFNWTIYSFTMGYFYKLKYVLIFVLFYGILVWLNHEYKTRIHAKNSNVLERE